MHVALAALACIAVAGCASDANPVRDIAVASGITGGEPRPAPDFVTRTRPADIDFAPVGVSAPARATRPKDRGAVTGAEAEMNALRARNEQRGATARRAGASAPASPVAAPPPPEE